MTMNREILRIALPAIVTNVTVPLLGLIDTAIAGHLGQTECIGAIAVGSMMFGLVYQNFVFFRMGTSGLTAQAYGGRDMTESALTLMRSLMLAVLIGVLLIALQYPLQLIVLLAVGASGEVATLAQSYFYIVIWGAPAILMTMSIKGWFLGMQDSRTPMVLSIFVNLANIAASLVAVFVLHKGFVGIAFGTIVAEYAGLVLALLLVFGKRHQAHAALRAVKLADVLRIGSLRRFFTVNRDIFLRSVCLMAITLTFTSLGAREGDVILAANALMIQLFLLISYFLDGFAFAGEALVGRFLGAGEMRSMRRCINWLFVWGAAIMVVCAVVYGVFAHGIFGLLTDDALVVVTAMDYRLWCIALPVMGMAGFVWDGVFIGMTATRGMLISIVISATVFFAICFLPFGVMTNHRLWAAFISYLAVRGLAHTIYYQIVLRPRSD